MSTYKIQNCLGKQVTRKYRLSLYIVAWIILKIQITEQP